MGQILLDFPAVSQKWFSYNSVKWKSSIGLSRMAEFGLLLYNCVIKTVNLLAARNNNNKKLHMLGCALRGIVTG